MEYTAIIEKGNNGYYVAQCAQIPAAITQGKTIEEVKENLKDAIHMVLDYEKSKTLQSFAGRKFFRRKLAMA
jgi:predicted RNase H-like HicB family nuclease